MPSPNNVLTADSYIQDGLVFQLDGIDYGGIDGQWIDRKNGIIFHCRVGNLREGNHFILSVPYGFLYCDTNIAIDINSQIDSVYDLINYRQGALINANSLMSLSCFSGNVLTTTIEGPCVGYQMNLKACSAISINKMIENGTKKQPGSASSLNRFTEKVVIGRLQYQHSASLEGSIYAIRIYSRQLSDREILINQKIDNARFELGLNIPDEVLPATRSLSLLEPFTLPDESESEQEPTNDNSDER